MNLFTSKTQMKEAGWSFDWTDGYVFKPIYGQRGVPSASYWGFNSDGTGCVSLTLQSNGALTLDYGNSFTAGSVEVSLNDVFQDSAGASVLSRSTSINFQNGDVLKICDVGVAIIVLNELTFSCTEAPTPTPTPDHVTTYLCCCIPGCSIRYAPGARGSGSLETEQLTRTFMD